MFNWFKKKVNPVPVAIEDVIASPFPKVIREPKLKPTMCSCCNAVYQAELHHLRPSMFSLGVKRMTMCPVCNQENVAEFEKVEERNDDGN